MLKEVALRYDDGREVVVPAPTGAPARVEKREDGTTAGCVVVGGVGPFRFGILLRDDGGWDHLSTEIEERANPYLHLTTDPGRPPTDAQRRTVARWWLKIDPRPYGAFPGQTLCAWAFEGLTPDQVSKEYGDGSPVALAGPFRT